ncbi:bifunctional CCAAT-binding factor/Nucleolar complex protein 4 [Babesia duncani]|uniref:Bifunctional CCAAT-binding factor/Nucleolar complex protein 4 n=1 Tax=Babesia duncani TaxID=323732 RepID=A0AAD9PJ43_9APIC|nr:bifunctional CCAAT-binding factor/Nucleolar complex protein 4 [Babesia duncani]
MASDLNITNLSNSCQLLLDKLFQTRENFEKDLQALVDKIYIIKANFGLYYDAEFFKSAANIEKSASDELSKAKSLSWRLVSFLLLLFDNSEHLELSIHTFFRLVRLESKLMELDTDTMDKKEPVFALNLFQFFICKLLQCRLLDTQIILSSVTHYMVSKPEYCYYMMLNVSHILHLPSEKLKIDQEVMHRLLLIMLNMPCPQLKVSRTIKRKQIQRRDFEMGTKQNESSDDDGSSIELLSQSSDESHKPELSTVHIYKYRKIYVKAWLSLMLGDYPIPSKSIGLLLQHIPKGILPYLSNPLVIADWIIAHNDGPFGVLALSCVFELIIKYGLGQESQATTLGFYSNVYNRITHETFAGPYARVFLSVLNESLRSFMIPVRLVRGFIKRLVRTACVVSSAVAVALLAIALNLLKAHHETCLDLVSRTGEPTCDLNYDNIEAEHYLWEIPLLLQHHSDFVAKVAAQFYSDLTSRDPCRIQAKDFINCDMEFFFKQHLDMSKRNQNIGIFRSKSQYSTSKAATLFSNTLS